MTTTSCCNCRRLLFGVCLAMLALTTQAPAAGEEYFQIKIVDEQTGRGVPLVALRTVNNIRHWTDSAGVVAFYEPGLMDREVFFHVESHGYEMPADGFGFRGRRVMTTPGGEVTWKIRRRSIAERLYRMTGEGIYRDSVLLKHSPPIEHPLLGGGVLGSDSVVNAVFRGRVYWFWGDTNQVGYPLGNFHVPGAVSRLPNDGGLDVERGVNLEYFTADTGFAKETARMPGQGPTWISGLTTLRDKDGAERLFAGYVKVRGAMDVYHRGLVEFDDEKQVFQHVADFSMGEPHYPEGHTFTRRDGDVEYVYFASPYPLVRVPANPESLADLAEYESYTCLVGGTRRDDKQLDRDDAGRLRYAWRKNTPLVDQQLQQKLVAEGKARPEEFLLQLRDVETGKTVIAHSGSVYWNAHRRRWVMIAVEVFGTSLLGEVWYAEADAPEGPWCFARKIVSHEKYSFYNPKQHPMFDAEGGRVLYFEGTYTHTFSGNEHPTPRYDYNQILYKLDLADPRLALPVAIYPAKLGDAEFRLLDGVALGGSRSRPLSARPAFFALDRPIEGAVAVTLADPKESSRLVVAALGETQPNSALATFYALPVESDSPAESTTLLYEFLNEAGEHRYATQREPPPGYRRSESPLCRVWRSPTSQTFNISN
ncbi:MAG: hypothetical protein RIC55_27065 [Pirellulaceae bacterium]